MRVARPRFARGTGWVLAAVLALGACTGGGPDRPPAATTSDDPTGDAPRSSPDATATAGEPGAGPAPAVTVDADVAAALVADVEAARDADAATLLGAGVALASGPWADLDPGAHEVLERPVLVADVDVTEGGARAIVRASTAVRLDAAADEVALRFLPAHAPAQVGARPLRVTVARDGALVDAVVDGDGARIVVPLDPPVPAGGAVRIDVDADVVLAALGALDARSTPAATGLLARTSASSVFGQVLPVVGGDVPAPVAWADVAAQPAAVTSVVVHHDGPLATGGSDGQCPRDAAAAGRSCTWSRGVALRDVALVALTDDAVLDAGPVGDTGVRLRVHGAAPDVAARVADEASSALVLLDRLLGALAWDEVDVVVAPLGERVLGLEFPGLVVVREDVVDDPDETGGGIGSVTLVHEMAHQWFHALVGNDALRDPVVDESLAQYLAVRWVRSEVGDAAADAVVARALREPYLEFRASGVAEVAPASPAAAFTPTAYVAGVYRRAALGWLAAEDAVGTEVVDAFLADLVVETALDIVTADDVLDRADRFAPALGAALRASWTTTDPLPSSP